MAKVRAKETCYLSEAGYKTPEDGEFEYNGPKHDSLELVNNPDLDDGDTRYHAMSREELKAELNNRGISFAPNAGEKNLRGLLETDDASK